MSSSIKQLIKQSIKQCAVRIMLMAGLCTAQPSLALEIEQLQVRFHDGEYQLNMTALLSAPLRQVETVLRDYASYPQLDSRILTAQVLSRATPNEVELFTRLNVCLAFLCRKVERVEQVVERPGALLATVIAARSDAVRGSTHIQLSAEGPVLGIGKGERTRVIYTTQIVPKFWVPPLLGRSLMLRSLREATISLFGHIEQRAMVLPATDALPAAASMSVQP